MQNSRLVISVRCTEACNFDCPFCEYRRSNGTDRSKLSPDSILCFCDAVEARLKGQAGRALIVWIGGEPFAWPEIAAVTATIKERVGLDVGVVTNGSAIARRVLGRWPSLFDEVTISVDGNPEVHAKLRGLSLAEASRIHEFVVQLASQRHPLVRVATIVCRSNYSTIDRTWLKFAQHGVREICLNSLYDNGDSGFYQREQLTLDQWDEFAGMVDRVGALLAALGCRLLGSTRYLARIRSHIQRAPVAIPYCSPGDTTIFIDGHGNFGPCAYTTKLFGTNIHDVGSSAVLDDVIAKWKATRRTTMFRSCFDCPETNLFGKFEPASDV